VEIMTLAGQNASVILSRKQLVTDCSVCVLLLCYLRKPDANILDERNSKPAGSKGFDDVL
jgi:hypothetical protein